MRVLGNRGFSIVEGLVAAIIILISLTATLRTFRAFSNQRVRIQNRTAISTIESTVKNQVLSKMKDFYQCGCGAGVGACADPDLKTKLNMAGTTGIQFAVLDSSFNPPVDATAPSSGLVTAAITRCGQSPAAGLNNQLSTKAYFTDHEGVYFCLGMTATSGSEGTSEEVLSKNQPVFGEFFFTNINPEDNSEWNCSAVPPVLNGRKYSDAVNQAATTYQLARQPAASAADPYLFNSQGCQEKWISGNSAGAPNGTPVWYFIKPDGKLYTGGCASPVFLADLGTPVYRNPNLLLRQSSDFRKDVFSFQQRYALKDPAAPPGYPRYYYNNTQAGYGEKYLQSANYQNAGAGYWYVMMPDGKIFPWLGSIQATVAAPAVATFPENFTPSLLQNATPHKGRALATLYYVLYWTVTNEDGSTGYQSQVGYVGSNYQ